MEIRIAFLIPVPAANNEPPAAAPALAAIATAFRKSLRVVELLIYPLCQPLYNNICASVYLMTFRLGLLVAPLLLFGCAAPKHDTPVALPDLPQVATGAFLPAVRQEMEKAYDAARARPQDPEANGHLGMVLHAHGQFEAAAVCYRRAMTFDPASFNWIYCLALAQDSLGKND